MTGTPNDLIECRFLVIGAGIAGASAAYGLAAHGPVIITEMEAQPGYHTTGRSAAFFSEAYGNETFRKLNLASRSFLENPPASVGESSFLSPRGGLWIAREDQRERLSDYAREAGKYVPALTLLSGDEVRGLCPALNNGIVAGLHEPNAREIDVARLHQTFLKGAKAQGARLLISAPVIRMERKGDGWRVHAGDVQIQAETVVNAAGAWGDHVARLAGLTPVGLTPLRRTVITFDLPPDLAVAGWPLVIDADEEFYFKPETGALLASPANQDLSEPCDAQPEELDIALAVDRIERATHLKIGRIRSKWAGLRTFAPDRSVVVGPDSEDASFIWCCGQGGYGIQTSPAMSRLTTALALGQTIPEDLANLGLRAEHVSPGRFKS